MKFSIEGLFKAETTTNDWADNTAEITLESPDFSHAKNLKFFDDNGNEIKEMRWVNNYDPDKAKEIVKALENTGHKTAIYYIPNSKIVAVFADEK